MKRFPILTCLLLFSFLGQSQHTYRTSDFIGKHLGAGVFVFEVTLSRGDTLYCDQQCTGLTVYSLCQNLLTLNDGEKEVIESFPMNGLDFRILVSNCIFGIFRVYETRKGPYKNHSKP